MHRQFFLLAASLLLVGFAFLSFAPSTYAATTQQHSVPVTHANLANSCPPILSLGSNDNGEGFLVGALQNDLNNLYLNYSDTRWFANSPYNFGPYTQDPYHPLLEDGDFGMHTYNAVRDYQAWNGLKVDGIVGPQTWSSLGEC